jgi:hypothetical protein
VGAVAPPTAHQGRVCRGPGPRLDRLPHVALHAGGARPGTKARSGREARTPTTGKAKGLASRSHHQARSHWSLRVGGTALLILTKPLTNPIL